MTQTEQVCIQQTQQWIQSFIINLNLCPFARREMDKGSVRFAVSSATTPEKALDCLETEIKLLNTNAKIETSFLLFPMFLQDFFDYLDFSYTAEANLLTQGYEGVYQLATFHPNYCFADANVDDVTNYTNRSPYPMLHILREESVEKAIAHFGNTGSIPENNMASLRRIGLSEVEKMMQECLKFREEQLKE